MEIMSVNNIICGKIVADKFETEITTENNIDEIKVSHLVKNAAIHISSEKHQMSS